MTFLVNGKSPSDLPERHHTIIHKNKVKKDPQKNFLKKDEKSGNTLPCSGHYRLVGFILSVELIRSRIRHPKKVRLFLLSMCAWYKHIMDLLYPPLCASCGLQRPLDDHIFCLDCLNELPETGFHQHASNPFMTHFKGRIDIKAGAAFLYFSRGGGTQRLLHQIKYNNQPDLIFTIGKWYGRQLLNSELWQGIDVIVPVPLHWKKQRKRGYNQSAVFGEGIAEVMGITCAKYALKRITHDKSLTGMNRLKRVETIGTSFVLQHPRQVKNKHVLLVDDVLTTGATLESCALALIGAPVASTSMVTIATGEL
jgi:ComF family protein